MEHQKFLVKQADREKKESNMKIRAQYQQQINDYAQRQEDKMKVLRKQNHELQGHVDMFKQMNKALNAELLQQKSELMSPVSTPVNLELELLKLQLEEL